MPSDNNQHRARVNAVLEERARQHQQQQWGRFLNNYVLNIIFPAQVSSSDDKKALKTSPDLIQARLLENGVLFDDLQTLPQLQEGVAKVVDNLMRTECYNSVHIEVDTNKKYTEDPTQQGRADDQNRPHQLNVILDEKKWYKLYIGGGFKQQQEGVLFGFMEQQNSKIPSVQFETSIGLLNLTGYADNTKFQYTIDPASNSSLLASHERPLYAWLGEESLLGSMVLASRKGSQVSASCRAVLDTMDYEWTRSYKEHLRSLSARIDNTGNVSRPLAMPDQYWGLECKLELRDVIPRKHATLPYAADASPEIVASSGTSLLSSVSYEVRSNGEFLDNRFQPTQGFQYHTKYLLAGPPGDVGYAKVEGGMSLHVPLSSTVSLHGLCESGILKPLTFGGLCKTPTISDRFFLGGPAPLRGFCPAGIGPRAKSGRGSGDALGGHFFSVATFAASMALPGRLGSEYGVRAFGFGTAGTLLGTTDGVAYSAIAKSARTSVGAGISAGTPMGRVEATYAWPLRYGSRDSRRNVQFGFGFSFG
jgi:outer membrane protein assembly factor BamA